MSGNSVGTVVGGTWICEFEIVGDHGKKGH